MLLHPCARARLIRTALGCQPAVEVDVVAAQHVAFAEVTEEAPALERGTIPRREIGSGRRRPRRRHFAAKEDRGGVVLVAGINKHNVKKCGTGFLREGVRKSGTAPTAMLTNIRKSK